MTHFTYDRIREFFKQAELVVKRIEGQHNLEERMRSIDAACVQNKQLLQDPASRAEVEQQKIAIKSESRRLEQLEKDQVKFMRKWMADVSMWIDEVDPSRPINNDMLAGVRATSICLEEIDLFSELKDIEYLRYQSSGILTIIEKGIQAGWLESDPYEKDLAELREVREIYSKITALVLSFEKRMVALDPEFNDKVYEDPVGIHTGFEREKESFFEQIDVYFKDVPTHLFQSTSGINDLMMDLLRLNITKEAQLDLVTVSKVFVRDSEYWQTISNKAKTLQKRLARLAVDFEKEKQFLKEALVFARQDDFRKAKEIETSISGRYPNLGAEELRGLIQKSEHRANHVRDEFRAFLRENNPRCPIPEDRTRNFTDYDKYSSYIAGKLMNPFNVGITRYSWSRRIDEFVAEVKEDEAVARKLPESEMRDTLVSSCGQVLKEVAKLREAIDRALRRRRVNASLAILSLVAIFIVGGFFVTAKLLIPHTGFVVDGRGTIFESIELLRPDGTLIDTEEYKVVSNQKRFEIRDLLPGSYVLRFKEDGVYPYYLPVSAMIGTLTDITNDLLKVISVSDEAALSVNMIAGSKLVIKDSVNGWESLLKSKLVEIPSVSSVQSCVFNPVTNNLIIGYLNGGIKIYDINRKLVLREYSEHKDSVEALAIDSTGRYLLSASIDRSMKLWDLKRDVLLRNMEGHGGAVHDIVFKPGEMIVASGCADGMIRLWDISKGELIRVLETTAKDDLAGRNWSITPKLEDVKFSVNKEFLSLLSSQGEHSLMHSNNVYDLEFTKDGSTLIAGRANGTIDIWNLYGDNQMQEELKALKMELEKIQKTKQSIEKESIVDESALGILEEDVLDMVSELKQKVKTAELVAQNEGNDPELELISKIRNLETKIESIQKHIVVHGHKSPVYAIAISDDARYIFSAGADGTIKMWDYNNSELLQNFIGHAATITSLLYVDGKVVSGSSDGEYVIWDAKRSEVLEKTKAHENSIQDMALSPNGKFFVSGSLDTNVRIWNFQNQFKIPMPVGSFTVRVSKDGFQDFEQDFELKKGQLLELKTVLLKN